MKINNFNIEAKFYDKTANEYNERSRNDLTWLMPEHLYLFKSEYFKKNSNVIEMGCGSAISTKIFLSRLGKRVNYTGIDASKKLLKIASKNIPKGKFRYADMSRTGFPNGKTDIILSLGALHHVEDKISTLSHWVDLLKKGGLLLLREPTYEVLKKGEGESPVEEGIKLDELEKFIKSKRMKILSRTYFSTPAFHLFNRVLIKAGLGSWKNIKYLWYPILFLDTKIAKFLKGGAFVIALQKR